MMQASAWCISAVETHVCMASQALKTTHVANLLASAVGPACAWRKHPRVTAYRAEPVGQAQRQQQQLYQECSAHASHRHQYLLLEATMSCHSSRAAAAAHHCLDLRAGVVLNGASHKAKAAAHGAIVAGAGGTALVDILLPSCHITPPVCQPMHHPASLLC